MCGRYYLLSPADLLKSRFLLDAGSGAIRPRYNIAPGQDTPVIVYDDGRVLRLMRWGLVPSWATDPANVSRTINARVETAATLPSFREPFRKRRALVPANGFYEWKKEPDRRRPFAVRRKDGAPFAFAGLWDRRRAPDGKTLETFTILTTDASETVAKIHDRMPVILTPETENLWLDPKIEDPAKLATALASPGAAALEAVEVSPAVNSPENDGPEVLEPPFSSAPPASRQRSLFEEDF